MDSTTFTREIGYWFVTGGLGLYVGYKIMKWILVRRREEPIKTTMYPK